MFESLKELQENNFKLFLISNQPDYAKGKTSLESLAEVHDELHEKFIENKIFFTRYYYCYHHPEGVVSGYSINCECRKPGNYFVKHAIKEFDLSIQDSWFVGDRDKDVECGKRSGLRTIRIESGFYEYNSSDDADHIVKDLNEAVKIILSNRKNKNL